MKQVLVIIFSLSTVFSFSQLTQTVRGKVFDAETNYPLAGVRVQVITDDTNARFIGGTDANGEFTLKKIPVGKHRLISRLNSYEQSSVIIEVNSGKELILNIPLMEMIVTKEEIVVTARKKGEVLNEMAVLSAQQFSVEETNRYPGSRMDPARMASNFAGVQGSDDSRNDIVVRGNSPLGVVYRVEGIDIPNPSHFAVSGSTGGPVSILNNKILGNSDFFMSAFPAEYGNSTSGVFDLKLRNGNNNQHEFTGQFGLFGTEVLAEGPLGKNGNSSYLVMGRYSSLAIFQKLGVSLGTDAVPVYGDGAFKFNWKLKKGGQLSWWGMGGKSDIDIMISEQTKYSTEFYGEGDRDQYFGTSMIVSGLTYKKSLNEKTYISATLSGSREEQHTRHEYLHRSLVNLDSIVVDSSYQMLGYDFRTMKLSGYFAVNHKISKQHLIKAGVNFDVMSFNLLDSVLNDLDDRNSWKTRWDYNGLGVLVQPFVQWKWKMSDKMDLTAGAHAQYFSLSNSVSAFEPRLGWKYRMKGDQAIFAGAGLHSQTQPYYTYMYDPNNDDIAHNSTMDFSRSLHSGLGYEKSFGPGLNFRTEAYYQYLYNLPISSDPNSFSLVNAGGGFTRVFPNDILLNNGKGINYGIEFTLQKYFSKSFFFMVSASIYDSKYLASDGIWRNTSYKGANNSKDIDLSYVWNVLAGKEFKISKNQIIGLGTKITRAGGRRYGKVDIAQTMDSKEIIFQDSLFNELTFSDYFRVDLKINWRMNTKKLTHEFGLDLVNLLNTKNLLSLAYAPSLDPNDKKEEPTAEKQQLGRLPIFYYKIDFKLAGEKE
ncbi:MAG: TonB-dependent receptor [Bacteroidota bacterium]